MTGVWPQPFAPRTPPHLNGRRVVVGEVLVEEEEEEEEEAEAPPSDLGADL